MEASSEGKLLDGVKTLPERIHAGPGDLQNGPGLKVIPKPFRSLARLSGGAIRRVTATLVSRKQSVFIEILSPPFPPAEYGPLASLRL